MQTAVSGILHYHDALLKRISMVLKARHQNELEFIFQIESNFFKIGKLKPVFKTLTVVPEKVSSSITYVIDFYRVSNVLQPAMFADDAKSFFLMKTLKIC